MKALASTTLPGGTFKLADDLILTRMDYGAISSLVHMYSGHQKITMARSEMRQYFGRRRC